MVHDKIRNKEGWKKRKGSMSSISEIEKEIERASTRDDRSYHSVSNGFLPALGVRSPRKANLRPFIISSFEPRYSSGTIAIKMEVVHEDA